MKIINLIQKPQLRGAEIFACQLSEHLMKKGHQVLVVSIFQGDSQLPFTGESIHLSRPLSVRFTDLKGWQMFNRIIKDYQPDIIQANAADTLKFAVSSKIIFSWKTPIIFRNANKMGDFITSKWKWRLNKFYLSKLSYVISVSEECKKDFINTFHFPKNKIETVEIGVEAHKIRDIPKDLAFIFKKGPVVVHIGGFVPEKNHNGLIDIFEKLHEKIPTAQLLLLGKGKLMGSIKEKVEKLNLEQNVHFLGYRRDVLEILHYSDAFVLPSLIEGLPAVILEAMYCETPVVAFNIGGVKEIVIPGKTGWLVEKEDYNSFRNSLEEILGPKKNVFPITTAAKTMITNRFLNDAIADRFVKCYEKVV